MMKSEIKIICLSELLLLVYVIIFKLFISEYLIKYVELINILFLSLLVLLVYVCLGFHKKRLLIHKNVKQILIICFIGYYVLTYIFGLFFGFLKNGYSLTFFNILSNVLCAMLFYILKEIYRYIVVQKLKKNSKFLIFLLVFILASLDIVMEINAYSFNDSIAIFEFIEASVLPRVALSGLLTYMSYKFDYKITFFYLLLYELPKYFLPIFPDLGEYIGSIIKLIFIFICYYQLSILLEKYERKLPIARQEGTSKIKMAVVSSFLLIIVGLVSGVFKYHLFAIGSNSMVPVFSKGDVVLINKLVESEIETIEDGEIIAFHYNNQIIVHRVVLIEKTGDSYIFRTKGDNNDSIDAWVVDEGDIYGRVEFVVKYLGIPSVELGELMNKEW